MLIERVFLNYSIEKLRQLHSRIEACLDKLDHDQIWARGSGNANAVGNLVLHLCGNLRQWIGFGVAGMPDIRVRDREFAARGGIEATELKERLRAIVEETTAIVGGITAERLVETTRVQKYELTVLEAIYHVVEHFSQHTGQIIFATKALTGEDMGFYSHLAQPKHSEQTP